MYVCQASSGTRSRTISDNNKGPCPGPPACDEAAATADATADEVKPGLFKLPKIPLAGRGWWLKLFKPANPGREGLKWGSMDKAEAGGGGGGWKWAWGCIECGN